MFEEFWKAYPRRVGKKDAIRAWSRLTEEQQQAAIDVIENHVRYWRACDTDTKFIPHPSTWLNGWRFDDEIAMPQPKAVPVVAWWTSERGVIEQGLKVGCRPRPGEDMSQYKGRVAEASRRAA